MERVIIGVWAIIMGLGLAILGPHTKSGDGEAFFLSIGLALLAIGVSFILAGLHKRAVNRGQQRHVPIGHGAPPQ